MVLFLVLIMFLIIGCFIKIKLNIKIEESVFIAFFGSVLVFYVFGLFNILVVGFYFLILLFIFSLGYVIYNFIKSRVNIHEVLTLPIIIYIILMIIIFYKVKDLSYIYYDEFMFWGTNLKTMFSYDLLWAEKSIDGIHLVYPPFTAIAEYIFCKINTIFSEGVTYFAIISLILTSFLPIFKKEKYCIKSLIKIILSILVVYFTINLFNYDLANLSVDLILGLVFGVIMYLVYEADNKKDYIVISILMASITLMKPNGILFAGIGIMQLFFKKLFYSFLNRKSITKKEIIKNFSGVFILLLLIISTSLSWKTYYTLNGKKLDDRHDKNTTETINVKEFINASLLNGKASERNTQISRDFYNKMDKDKISNTKYFNTVNSIWLLINIVFILVFIFMKKRSNFISNMLSINLGFLLYIVSNIIVFMFIFQINQGEMLMGFERYMPTYLIAMIINLFFIITSCVNIKTFFLVVIYLVLSYTGFNSERVGVIINDITFWNANDIIKNVKDNEKVFIIDQKLDAGFEFVETKYLISPIKTNLLYEWNIGYSTYNIFYKLALTKEEFIKLLKKDNYDYIYLVYINKSFLYEYGDLFIESTQKEIENLTNSYNRTNGLLINLDKELR